MATHTTLLLQPPPAASTYNYPCGDLLDGGRRREYLEIAVPLYRASTEGDLKATKAILHGREHLVRYSITKKKETPLHVAAASHNTELVRYLVNMMSEDDLELHNGDGNTALCIAAISGNVAMAKIMLRKNPTLPTIYGSEKRMPLYWAAFHGKREMVRFLYEMSDRMMGNCWTNDNINEVLLKCVEADIFDVAQQILEGIAELPQNKQVWDVLHVLARKPGVFHEISRTIFNRIKPRLAFTRLVTRTPLKGSNATPLLRLLWKRILLEKPEDVIDEILRGPMIEKDGKETHPSQILFIAAKKNNIKFLVELIREYSELIWEKNDDDGQTIFHVAVSYRHHDIYNLLYEIGSTKDLITPITDNKGNNILHLAAKNSEQSAYDQGWEAAPFDSHWELLWYKEVWDILPPPCREVENADGQTPQELFMKKQTDLVSKGMSWMNKTTNISMVVAALACTIGFSVAYSVPGGFDQNTGYPIFLKNRQFIAFIVTDSISFVCSAMSIIIFLKIILSRHHGKMELLLPQWLIAQLLLLLSIILLVFAFAYSSITLYNSIWSPFIIYLLGGMVCFMCLGVFNSFYEDLILAQKGRKILFRPKKCMLHLRK